MQLNRRLVGLCLTLAAVSAAAQTTVTTSGGTTNTVPVFTGGSTLGNSVITQSGGNVGLGTTTPQAALDIVNWAQAAGPGVGIGITLHNGSGTPQTASTTRILFEGGSVGDGPGVQPFAMIQSAGSDGSGSNGFLGFQTAQGGVLAERVRIAASGNMGIGTSNPGSALEINGNVKLSSGSGASVTFADGTIQSTAWTGTLCGGDYAESVDVSGKRSQYEPGDVIVIDPATPGKFLKSAQPYSSLVAGIYSTKPGMIGRRQLTDPKIVNTEVPMAMIGVVPTKVTAENGPIKVGDLLVTSSTPGRAMKGTDRNLMLGAVVGKAMGDLALGNGVVEVLVTLQ